MPIHLDLRRREAREGDVVFVDVGGSERWARAGVFVDVGGRERWARDGPPWWLRRGLRVHDAPLQLRVHHAEVDGNQAACGICAILRRLWPWARHHGLSGLSGLSGLWAALFPAQLDSFIAVSELALFAALVDRWDRCSRIGAWCVTLAGLVVSVTGNVGHIAPRTHVRHSG